MSVSKCVYGVAVMTSRADEQGGISPGSSGGIVKPCLLLTSGSKLTASSVPPASAEAWLSR